MQRSERGLARAVGAEQREHLAPPHVEVDAEQHLHGAVGEVQVADLEDVVLGVVATHPGGLGPLLLELLHDPADVAPDVGGAARQEHAADDGGGMQSSDRPVRTPQASLISPARTAPRKAPERNTYTPTMA